MEHLHYSWPPYSIKVVGSSRVSRKDLSKSHFKKRGTAYARLETPVRKVWKGTCSREGTQRPEPRSILQALLQGTGSTMQPDSVDGSCEQQMPTSQETKR